ncbi:MAG: biotin/lipoyl-containing protein [Myxococcota bacterium]
MPRSTTYHVKNLAKKDAEAVQLEVEGLGEGRYAVTLDGHRYELESLILPHGSVSLLVDGHSLNVDFDEKGDEVDVLVRGQVMRFDVADERKLRMRAASAGFVAEGKQTVAAPMPGKIVKVFVKVGDEVAEGQGLVVVEAMKMENELKSPKAGKVTEVLVKEGVAVENGAALVVVE